MKGLTHPQHRVCITNGGGAKLDLLIWLTFFREYNGMTPFLQWHWRCNETLQLFTAAAASIARLCYIFCREVVLGPLVTSFCCTAISCIAWAISYCSHRVLLGNVTVVHMVNNDRQCCFCFVLFLFFPMVYFSHNSQQLLLIGPPYNSCLRNTLTNK